MAAPMPAYLFCSAIDDTDFISNSINSFSEGVFIILVRISCNCSGVLGSRHSKKSTSTVTRLSKSVSA